MATRTAARLRSARKPGATVEKVSPARLEAFAILLEVEQGFAHADDLLRSRRVNALSAQDRHLATALVMGVLRWQLLLDARVRSHLAKPNAKLDPEVRIALRMGAFQLLYLDKIPQHASISESVALAKLAGHRFASGMVNAVLRKLAGEPRPDAAGLAAPGLSATQLAATAHPEWMVHRWVAFYGLEATQAICQHGQAQPELSIRLGKDAAEVERELAEAGIEPGPGALLSSARRVLRGDVTATEAYRSGRLRIQEEGSQLIAELAGTGNRILDCCAAPGGKALVLAEGNPGASVTANELIPARLEAMRRRFAELPEAGRIELRQGDAAELSGDPAYDLVLADVPCSGTGTLGRNPEIRHRLAESDLVRHHERQCAILRGAMRAASAAGARVLYSTCSLELEENAQVVDEVLDGVSGWRRVSLAEGIDRLAEKGRLSDAAPALLRAALAEDGTLTLLPGSLGPDAPTDGFFIAMLEKQ